MNDVVLSDASLSNKFPRSVSNETGATNKRNTERHGGIYREMNVSRSWNLSSVVVEIYFVNSSIYYLTIPRRLWNLKEDSMYSVIRYFSREQFSTSCR